MKTGNALLMVLAALLVVSLAAIWFYPSVQDYMDSNTMWNGINRFDRDFRARSIDSLESFADPFEKKTLIVIPYLEFTDADKAEIKSFVEGGDTLVLMDDFGYGNSILEYLGVEARFAGSVLLDPLFCYKNQYFPRITDFPDQPDDTGIRSLTLNHATALQGVDNAEVLARSSEESFLDVNRNETPDPAEPRGPLPVAAIIPAGGGTVVLIADPSLIVNTMVGMVNNNAFVKSVFKRFGGRPVYLDRSHISKAPLDTSRIKLENTRETLSNPYIVLAALALFFIFMTLYLLKKEVKAIG